MKQLSKISPKIIISGGGTGGHIYPAIAIADEIKAREPKAQVLFVGALGKMEMEKVPKAGYEIKGLPIEGLNRSKLFSNYKFPFKLLKSLSMAKSIINDFNPDIAVGTGGYASGPLLWQASKKNIPIVLQEQNSFPGITNKILKNKAAAICVAYDGITQFPANKIKVTGNPIRSSIFQNLPEQSNAKKDFGLDENKPVILSVGGSQGSKTLNDAWLAGLTDLEKNNVQLIWQTGKSEYQKVKLATEHIQENIIVTEFIYNMQEAYAAADVIISRAGAMAISELCLIGKPVILVPFPYASEDHQTKNAEALVNKQAAIMIKDSEVPDNLIREAIRLAKSLIENEKYAQNIQKLAKPNATKDIVDIIFNLIG